MFSNSSQEDKLKGYHQLIIILFSTEQPKESYTTVCDVLSQLGEIIPDDIGDKEAKQMLDKTSSLLSCASEEHFLGKRNVDVEIADVCATQPILSQAARSSERKLTYILGFYKLIALLSFTCAPKLTPVFVCRMTQLSNTHGLSNYYILGK